LREFYKNLNAAWTPRKCRELCRWPLPWGELIVFESVEEVHSEEQVAPYREWRENMPIIRVVVQAAHGYVTRRKGTVQIDGLLSNGAVERTINLDVPVLQPGHSVGYSFTGWVTSVRLVGWWLDKEGDLSERASS
jgi:hypothetical protein